MFVMKILELQKKKIHSHKFLDICTYIYIYKSKLQKKKGNNMTIFLFLIHAGGEG
jgi:hypothetical protein